MRYRMNFFGHVDSDLRVARMQRQCADQKRHQRISLGFCYKFTGYVDAVENRHMTRITGHLCPHQQYWQQGFSAAAPVKITQKP
jgi:hypothetical protein